MRRNAQSTVLLQAEKAFVSLYPSKAEESSPLCRTRSPVCRINAIWKLVKVAACVSACVWPRLQIAELERDGFTLSVIVLCVWGGRGCSCKWKGRKPSVGKGGKRRMIVRRVGGKERAETIVQLSKEAVIEGARIWLSIFLKTPKFHRKKVILCLIQCSALSGGICPATDISFPALARSTEGNKEGSPRLPPFWHFAEKFRCSLQD